MTKRSLPLHADQLGLGLAHTVCGSCRYHSEQRCHGPSSGSYLESGAHVVGCLDAARQREMSADLYRRFVPQSESNQDGLDLPVFTPSISNGLPALQDTVEHGEYAVYLSSLLTENGKRLRFDDPLELRKHLGLSATAKLGLVGVVADWRLEAMWHQSDIIDVWHKIARLNFHWTTSLSFSAWESMPRWDQMYNIDRGLVSHDLLAAHGVPTIPFMLFDCTREDREYSLDWLERRPDVQTVAVLTQCRRRHHEFLSILNEMDALSEGLGRPLRFLVVGASSPGRVRRLMERFPSASLVNETLFHKALNGQEMVGRSGRWRPNRSMPRALLFARSVRWFVDHCKSAASSRAAVLRTRRSLASIAPVAVEKFDSR